MDHQSAEDNVQWPVLQNCPTGFQPHVGVLTLRLTWRLQHRLSYCGTHFCLQIIATVGMNNPGGIYKRITVV